MFNVYILKNTSLSSLRLKLDLKQQLLFHFCLLGTFIEKWDFDRRWALFAIEWTLS